MKTTIIPITDLRKTNEISNTVKNNSPVFITKNGYSDMVIMSSDYFDKHFIDHEVESIIPSKSLNKKNMVQSDSYGLINVAACSFEVKIGNVEANVASIKEKILQAINNDVALLAFPELSLTGYSCRDLFIQSSLIEKSNQGLYELKEFSRGKDILFFVGAPFCHTDVLYNCSICIQNGHILAIMPKKFIPNYKEYYEGRYFTSYQGENTFVTFNQEEIPFGNKILFRNDCSRNEIVSSEVCEDAWTPYSPSLDQVLAGATIIFNLSASNETIDKNDSRITLVKEASRKLSCAYIYCSSPFDESTTDLIFSGENIIAEAGDIISKSELFNPNMLISTIDTERIKNKRRYVNTFKSGQDNGFMFIHYQAPRHVLKSLTNRHISAFPFIYSDFDNNETDYKKVLTMQALSLVKRLKAISCKTVVIGLSGGLDSTLALLVCHKAFEYLSLDKKGIICITLPCYGTSKRTYNNALKLAEALGNTLIEIDISKSVSQHLKDIDHLDHNYDITYENAQARERTKVLMDYANKVNGIVIGTGDLSEIALGWSTYNGDHMSMYAVNASIPKTLIRAMFTYFAQNDYKNISSIILDILHTPISPELKPTKDGKIDQFTEEIIGPYELHDFFLHHFMNNNYSFKKIYYLACLVFKDQFEPVIIKKWLKVFIKRFFSNQFKRSCMPDCCKVSSVSLSPRGDLRLTSDISYQSFIDDLDENTL